MAKDNGRSSGRSNDLQKAPGKLLEALGSFDKLSEHSGRCRGAPESSKEAARSTGTSGKFPGSSQALRGALEATGSAGKDQGAPGRFGKHQGVLGSSSELQTATEKLRKAIRQWASNITGRMPNQKLLEHLRGASAVQAELTQLLQCPSTEKRSIEMNTRQNMFSYYRVCFFCCRNSIFFSANGSAGLYCTSMGQCHYIMLTGRGNK